MLNKFWSWLLGLKDEESEAETPIIKRAVVEPESQDEGNFHNGTEGYQSGEYEGH